MITKLRSATAGDLEIISGWIADINYCRLWAGPGIHFPFTPESLRKDINFTPQNSFSLCDSDLDLLGFGQILEKEDFLHLARIIVSPEHRGKGLGEILCKNLIRVGRELRGDKAFSLNVYSTNTSALSLYLKLGFTPVNKPVGATAASDNIYMTLT